MKYLGLRHHSDGNSKYFESHMSKIDSYFPLGEYERMLVICGEDPGKVPGFDCLYIGKGAQGFTEPTHIFLSEAKGDNTAADQLVITDSDFQRGVETVKMAASKAGAVVPRRAVRRLGSYRRLIGEDLENLPAKVAYEEVTGRPMDVEDLQSGIFVLDRAAIESVPDIGLDVSGSKVESWVADVALVYHLCQLEGGVSTPVIDGDRPTSTVMNDVLLNTKLKQILRYFGMTRGDLEDAIIRGGERYFMSDVKGNGRNPVAVARSIIEESIL